MSAREAAVPLLHHMGVCPTCRQVSLLNRARRCCWCDSETEPIRLPRRGPRSGFSPQEAIQLHGFCTTKNVSVRVAVARHWERWGYSSARTCAAAIEKTWQTMGLPTPNPNGVGAHRRGEVDEADLWEPFAGLEAPGPEASIPGRVV